MSLEEIQQKFVGRWKLDRSENFDDFLREMGVNVLLRKKALSSRPEQAIEVKGGRIKITTKTGLKHQEDVFELGKEVERETNKIKHKITAVYEEGRIEVNSRPVVGNLKPQRTCRELKDGEMVMTIHIGDVICKRIFKKVVKHSI